MTLAVLPMYDLPQIMASTDALWAAIRDRLRAAGTAAPDQLDRRIDPVRAWTSPDLLLGHTCGMPYVQHLAGQVTLVATPDFGLEGCPPGYYRSVLVVRADDPRRTLAEFAGTTPAINEVGSQSGYAALMHAAAPYAASGRFFGSPVFTGAHASSALRVAEGGADIAAIDAVTWRLLAGHEPFTAGLRVLSQTEPTPGLPFITARQRDPVSIAQAIEAAIDDLSAGHRQALGLRGIVRIGHDAYVPLGDRLAWAEARHTLPPS